MKISNFSSFIWFPNTSFFIQAFQNATFGVKNTAPSQKLSKLAISHLFSRDLPFWWEKVRRRYLEILTNLACEIFQSANSPCLGQTFLKKSKTLLENWMNYITFNTENMFFWRFHVFSNLLSLQTPFVNRKSHRLLKVKE